MLLIALLAVTLVHARQISEQEAQLKAEKFFGKQGQNHSNMRRAPRKAPKLILASNREELYIFNDKANGGYVVISGDDRMPDVLAYSYDGVYNDNDIPDNMKAWMDDYAGQVAYLRSHPEAKVKKKTATERENISPLLTCWFNQDSPYNNKCPEVDGERCPTGCVATAMAQIMYYYQWPKQTTSVIPGYNYTLIDAHDTDTFNIVLPDQPITTIDWDNIRGEYWENYSNEEADAVSTLMLLCGKAVMMSYRPGGSGAFSDIAAKALRDYFGYDELLEWLYRNDYEIGFWEGIIYDELKNLRPIIYSGNMDYDPYVGPGHTFVVDGYEDGYFHVNWGWGGAYSYVLMTDVGGFNLYQDAIIGIQPAYPDTPSQYAVYDNGKMTLYYDTEKENRTGTVIPHKDGWLKYAKEITEFVIDPSFANLKQRILSYFFNDWSKLKSIDGIENLIKTDYVTDMSGMFYGCSSLTNLDLSGFKTDNVTNMKSMFSGCSSLTNLDVSGFKTDYVTDMSGMFYGCSSLTNLDVSGFKTDNVTNMKSMFSGCSSLTNLDVSGFKTGNVTNMYRMFSDCSSLTNLDVSGFKTDNVTDMAQMFYRCSSLTSLDLSSFKTDNVTDMRNMFYGCSSLTNLDLSSFKTDNVTNMGGMFSWCSCLKSLDLSSFKTDNVTDMRNMFYGCSSLTNLDVSGFKTDNVTNMGGMFSWCSSLISLDLSSFKTDNVTNMGSMFSLCSSLRNIFVSAKWTTHNVTSGDYMFDECYKLVGGAGTTYDWEHRDYTFAHIDGGIANPGYFRDKNLPNLDPYYVLNEDNTVLTFYFDDRIEARGGVVVYKQQWNDHSGDITTVVFDESFAGFTMLTSTAYWFEGCSKLESIVGINNLRTDNVTDMHMMFSGCSSLNSLDLSSFKTDNVTNMSWMFNGCSSLSSFDLSSFKTDNVTYMNGMFSGCSGLTSLDVSGFKTDKVTEMARMFSVCSSLASLDLSSFKTDIVTDMSEMFYRCSGLTSLDLSSFKTDNVTDMRSMFSRCSSLTSLDLSSFKTDKVTNMSYMFNGCSCLKKIFVSAEWKTNNVTSGDDMFYNCIKLVGGAGTIYDSNHRDYTYAHIDGGIANPGYFRNKNLPDPLEPYALLSEENTLLTFYYDDQMESRGGMDVYEHQWYDHRREIATVVFDDSFAGCMTLTSMSNWFSGCSKLSNIVGLGYLRTDNVTDMRNMFSGCSSLTSLDLSSFKTDNVTNTEWMFSDCSSLTSLDLSSFKTDNVTNMGYMFYGCSSLTRLDLSSFKTDNVTDMTYMFYGCSSLTRLDLSSFKTDNVTFMHYMFYGCSSLKKIYVASGWTTLNVKYGDYMFGGCTKLIGGAGTRYSSYNYNNNHASYAHIDGGPSNPGFFRDRNMPDFDPYILLSNNNTVLTFYCDDQMETRQGIDVYDQAWSSHSADIITVVFDESFVYCTTLTSTATWFKDFSKLSNIVGLDNLRTDNVTDMGYMFYGYSCLTSLNLSSFKTDNVTFMPYMFENCENLTTIYVREGWNTSNVGMSVNMFSNCPKLVGGEGTTYDKNHTSADYAHIDGGVSNPGYLTYKDYYNTLIYIVDGEEYRSYRLEIGEEITPEPKPTKEGYVFLGWDNIPATMPDYDVVVNGTFYLYGDVNTDKDVDVLDVVDIARYVVEIPSESFVKQLADINKDGNVNLGDAVTLVNEIAGEQNFVRAKASPKDNYTNDVLSLTEWNGCLSLNLQNERCYTAFQFDLYVPEGSDVTKMSLNTKRKQGHQLLYNKVKDGHYRVAALSTSNNEFIGKEGELMNILMNGVSDDEVSVRNIHFFDVKGNDYQFDDIEGANTTGLNSLTPALSEREGDIYNVAGQRLNKMQKGINIVGGKKVVIK